MSAKKLVFATTNHGKIRELRELCGTSFSVLSIEELENEGLRIPAVEEDADTFAGNALKKAKAFCDATKLPSLADDSGLCVVALGGVPGVHSARYGASDFERIAKLLEALKKFENREAYFETALAFVAPAREPVFESARLLGRIAKGPRGTQGFGYDPIFEIEDGRTLGEMSRVEKSKISHRGQAFVKILPALTAYFES